MTHGASNTNNFPKQDRFPLKEKARRFSQSVADSLLECGPKDWPRIKELIMGIFWEYEEAKNNQQSFNVNRGPNL